MYKKNIDFFIKNGLYSTDETIDYFIVVNGESTYTFPKHENLKVFYRDNIGFDFACYNYGIQETKKMNKKYDYYFCLNASCRGPFLPIYCKQLKWTEPFIQLFDTSTNIKLVGSTINMHFHFLRPHVQSYFFGFKHDVLDFLETSIFSKMYYTMCDVIDNQEIELSMVLLRNGWNISCIIPEFKHIDYVSVLRNLGENESYKNIQIYSQKFLYGDISIPGKRCFGRDIHPYESVFIKTNRNFLDDEINSLTRQIDNGYR